MMIKKLYGFLIIVFGISLMTCSTYGQKKSKKIDFFPGVEKREGLFYKEGTDQLFTGDTKSTYSDGSPYVTATFKNGKMHGEYIAYYANGRKMGVTHYQKGIRHGKAISWHENGKLASKVNFEQGKKDGKLKVYYPNGQINTEAFFDKGKRDSTYTQWEITGELYYRSIYEDGDFVKEKYFNQDSTKSKN